MSTYTQSIGLELITPGSQAGLWGNTTNNSLQLIDQAIAGVTPVYLDGQSGYTYILTDFNGAVDEARSAVLNVTYQTNPALGSNIIRIPSAQKLYVVRNSSGAPIVVQTAAAVATVTIANGEATLVFCDGSNAYPGIATAGAGTWTVPYGGTGVTTFGTGGFVKSAGGTAALSASSTINAATELSGITPVANGGTGKNTLASGSLLLGNGVGTVAELTGSAANQVPTWNGTQWIASAPSAAGVSSFNTRTGTVTLQSSDVTTALGFTPADAANFLSSRSQSGWQKLQNGIIIQWGLVISSGTSYGNWIAYFPITFPNALLRAVSTCAGYATVGIVSVGHGSSTNSYLYGTAYSTTDLTNWSITSGMSGSYIAIGY